MKSLIKVLLLFLTLNLSAQGIIEEVSDEEFGLDKINNRQTYLDIVDELKDVFSEIDTTLSKIKKNNSSLDIKDYNLQNMNSDEFNNLKLSDQLRVFQQNYVVMNDFTKDSLEVIQNNSEIFTKFCSLQMKLMLTFNKLLEEADRIQKSQEEDLHIAIADIKNAQSNAAALKQELEICMILAEKQAKDLKKAKWFKNYGTPILFIIGLGLGLGLGLSK